MSRFPDLLEHLGGVPVGSATNYAGWWNNETYFVDYDHGSGGDGRSMSTAKRYLENAISSAGAWDTIYIRPKDPTTASGGPDALLPESTTNWTIPYAKHGMNLIGAGSGAGFGALYGTLLQGTATAGATPALYIKAPYVTCENLAFHRGGSNLDTVGVAVKASYTDSGTDQAFQLTFSNCAFVDSDYGAAGKGYGLQLDSVWYSSIFNCTFLDCGYGIELLTTNSVPWGYQIVGCKFQAPAASVLCDIHLPGGVRNIVITECNFDHTVPSGGSPNRYVHAASTASTGIISKCYSGSAATTVGSYFTLNGIQYSQLYGGTNIDIMTNA